MEGMFEDKDKNLFPIGGFMPIDIPAVFRGVGKKLRDRMYRTIRPEEYSLEQVVNFVKGTPRQYYRNPNAEALLGKYTGQDSIIADYTQAPDYLAGGRYLTEEEREKLGVDKDASLKKYAVDDLIVPSKSKEGTFEFAYPNRLGSVPHLPTNANRVPDESWPHSHELGTFHQVKTNNDNGSSITYEDVYDINPFRGKSSEDDSTWRGVIRIGKEIGLDKIGDIIPWGKPFEMHGQQSYDKEGYPKKAEGGFLKPKDAWDKLSMRKKAEIMKLAIEGDVYDLDAIRSGYNEYAEGGGIANEIPMDYQPLVSNTYQPIVDALKTDNTGFNIDDYTYRVQKLHPEITRDQVQSLYNATPYIASDKVIGTREGEFRLGDETGYGRRVTLYPNAYTQNTGTRVTSSNANETMGDTLAHETNHLYTDVLLGGTNDAEGDLLWEAYRPGLVVQDSGFNGEFSEERAINAGIRNRISRENGNVIGEELDKAIDNTPDDVLMNMLFDPNNGYINQSGRKHMQDKNGNWNRTDAVRKALKDVALNQMTFPVENYAADGGKIHIKHPGRLTELKKRTGKTEAELYNDGNPAHKKMVVFARNARKWKH